MATVPIAQPYTLNDATLELGADDYTAAVSEVRFNPSASDSTWRGIGGNTLRFSSSSEWSVVIGYAQDLAPEGLSRYLLDHEGEKITATFTPVDGGPPVTATLTLKPGSLGGAADGNAATASVTLPVDGRPSFGVPAS